jgi:hypothetical protein
VRIDGVPFSRVYDVVVQTHDYELPQVQELARNLKAKGYIQEDKFGFLSPTALGEEVICALIPSVSEVVTVPPLPDLN